MLKEILVEETPNGSNRLFIPQEKLDVNPTVYNNLLVTLNSFSIWGKDDASNKEYMSWEFDRRIPKGVIMTAIFRILPKTTNKSGCNGCFWDNEKCSSICVQCDRFYINKTIKPDLYRAK